jgi:hypothetical protein
LRLSGSIETQFQFADAAQPLTATQPLVFSLEDTLSIFCHVSDTQEHVSFSPRTIKIGMLAIGNDHTRFQFRPRLAPEATERVSASSAEAGITNIRSAHGARTAI